MRKKPGSTLIVTLMPKGSSSAASGFRQAFDGELGRTIDAPAGIAEIAADRGKVQDVSRTLAAHIGQDGTGDLQEAEDIGGVKPFDFLGGCFLHGAEQAVTRIVSEDVDAAEAFDGFCRGLLRLSLIGDVKGDGDKVRVVAELVGDALRIAGCGDDRIAGCKRFLRHQRAEAAGCTSDEPDFHDTFLSSSKVLGCLHLCADGRNLTENSLLYKICYFLKQ